jgi:hypothetical protein
VNTTAVATIATIYRNDLENSADIPPLLKSILGRDSGLSSGKILDKGQLSALSFRQRAMVEILSDALKKNQFKSLLRLIASLTNGARSARRGENRLANFARNRACEDAEGFP